MFLLISFRRRPDKIATGPGKPTSSMENTEKKSARPKDDRLKKKPGPAVYMWFFALAWTVMVGLSINYVWDLLMVADIAAEPSQRTLILVHCFFWALGCLVIFLAGRALEARYGFIGQSAHDSQGEARQKVHRLVESRTDFQPFFDHGPIGAFLKDEKGDFLLVNQSFCSFLGLSRDQLLGQAGSDLLPPSLARKIADLEEKAVDQGREFCEEDVFGHHPLGEGPVVNLNVFPLYDSHGRLSGMGGILIDLSGRKTVEAELQAAKQMAEEANLLKSTFLSSLSQEIRTPLNGISAAADQLLETRLEPEQVVMISTIKNIGDSLAVILNDILNQSKIETSPGGSGLHSFSLRDLIYDGIKGLGPLARSKNLDINIQISPKIPDGLYGDGLRLKQLLLNLTSNALKFTNMGEVTVKVERLNSPIQTETYPAAVKLVRLRFSVRDTGIGIAPEKQAIIRKALAETNSLEARDYGGAGLGLAISYHLAAMMNTSLELESRVNEGSTFYFNLDLPVVAEADDDDLRMNPDSFEGYSVLLVDDSATDRRILADELTAWRLTVTEAGSTDEALKLLRSAADSDQPYSLIISDHNMPNKSGLQLVRAVKADYRLASTPVVLLSSAGLSEAEREELPLAAILTKPVRPRDLLRAVAAALGIWERFKAADLNPESPEGPKSGLRARLSALLVDSLELNRVVIAQMLGDLGHEVTMASDGAQALALLRDKPFDLVLVAIGLPVMDGFETLSHIRRMEQERDRRRAPVVAMNSAASKSGREKYAAMGFDGYLDQPALLSELSRLIDNLAQKGKINGE